MLAVLLVILLCSVTAAADTKDGTVRVLLTKLNLTNQVQLALDGSYTLGDMAFQRGCHVTVALSGGTLIVYYEGMAYPAGTSVTFVRHQLTDEQENGIRLNGGYELHAGDVTVMAKNGLLQCILTAPVEEYLLGVVPYEMSDSFPLEALKAQAIAARTYAMSKTGASGDYDLVDNTNDQAYYGIRASNVNAARAVRETAGICGYYQGKLAICYYTASNGGHVETIQNVWGSRSNADYITAHEDPYDLENESSVVKQAKISKTDAGVLTEPLQAALAVQLEKLGYDGEKENIRIDEMIAITPCDPQYADSGVMRKLRFSLRVSGRKHRAAQADDDEEVTLFAITTQTPQTTATVPPDTLSEFTAIDGILEVELDYFGTVEAMLSLSINGRDNEIVTVREQDDAFVIEARRYGHGVGMSQRGAQVMAGTYGWTYEQILKFYYPKMTLEKITWTATQPTPVSAAFLTTPGPAATPTPRPTTIPLTEKAKDGEYIATVTNIAATSYLNLRAKPDTTSDVLMRLYYGQELVVTSRYDDRWLCVRLNDISGYVMEEFVEKKPES